MIKHGCLIKNQYQCSHEGNLKSYSFFLNRYHKRTIGKYVFFWKADIKQFSWQWNKARYLLSFENIFAKIFYQTLSLKCNYILKYYCNQMKECSRFFILLAMYDTWFIPSKIWSYFLQLSQIVSIEFCIFLQIFFHNHKHNVRNSVPFLFHISYFIKAHSTLFHISALYKPQSMS